jgi:hypothetical protein
MKQALEALESWQKTCLDCGRGSEELGRATQPIAALRQAIAEAEQTDLARVGEVGVWGHKREWVGLHEHELQVLEYNDPSGERLKLSKAVEAKLKEKNT